MVHQAKGVAIDIEATALQSRPRRHTSICQPLFKPLIAPLAFCGVDRMFAAVAGVELADQLSDDGSLVLLHQIPEHDVDWDAARLNECNRFGAVVGPMQYQPDIGG